MNEILSLSDVKEAAKRLKGIAHYTPLDYSDTFSCMTGSKVYLKLENMQKTGSFKIRGAYNAIACLDGSEKERGVIAASAGNHAQGVAQAAALSGIKATIVMPESAPMAKVTATSGYGAEVVLAGRDYDEAYQHALRLQRKSGAAYIHGFDDSKIMAGQATISLELLEQLPDVDVVVVPVGGGGLIAGMAYTLKQLKPQVRVVGVQAVGAPAMLESKRAGELRTISSACTIADGIAVGKPGKNTFEMICHYVDDIVTVDDEEIARALLLLLERSKLVVEGAGAAGLAALLHHKVAYPVQKVAVILSGGNIDSNMMSVIIERGLIKDGRRLRISCLLPDTPGSLQRLLAEVSRYNSNVISITHDRTDPGVPLKKAQVDLILETRDQKHTEKIKKILEERGYITKEF